MGVAGAVGIKKKNKVLFSSSGDDEKKQTTEKPFGGVRHEKEW